MAITNGSYYKGIDHDVAFRRHHVNSNQLAFDCNNTNLDVIISQKSL